MCTLMYKRPCVHTYRYACSCFPCLRHIVSMEKCPYGQKKQICLYEHKKWRGQAYLKSMLCRPTSFWNAHKKVRGQDHYFQTGTYCAFENFLLSEWQHMHVHHFDKTLHIFRGAIYLVHSLLFTLNFEQLVHRWICVEFFQSGVRACAVTPSAKIFKSRVRTSLKVMILSSQFFMRVSEGCGPMHIACFSGVLVRFLFYARTNISAFSARKGIFTYLLLMQEIVPYHRWCTGDWSLQ